MTKQELQQQVSDALLDIGAVTFTPDEPVTFKSGIHSPVYVDNRCLSYHPAAWHSVIDAMRSWVREHDLAYDAIAGIEAAGIPHSAALGYVVERPSLFVRKQRKGHGKGQQIEGGNVDGQRILLIEDLVTTGGSSLAGVDALREAGAQVTDCITIVSYEFREALAAFDAKGVRLHTLAPFTVLAQRAHARGLFDEATLTTIAAWRDHPREWGV